MNRNPLRIYASFMFVLSSVFLTSCQENHSQTEDQGISGLELSTSSQPNVVAAWSLIVGQSADTALNSLVAPRAIMRFVLDIANSPNLCGVFSVSVQKSVSAPWQTLNGTKPQVRENSDNPLKEVTVCEVVFTPPLEQYWYAARLKYNGTVVRLDSKLVAGNTKSTIGTSFTSGKSDNAEVVVFGPGSIGLREAGKLNTISFGDSGCRGLPDNTDSSRKKQTCDDQSWPLPVIAQSAAALNPDLVLHVGDYRYFLEDEVSTDSWLYWQKDFFPAAQPLLLAAPWVFGRGNHEMCANGYFGPAYFQLFGAGTENTCVDSLDPWYFDVAVGGIGTDNEPHRFIVIDTNDDEASSLTTHYEAAIDITREVNAPKSVWWLTHIPAYTVLYYSGSFHTGDSHVRDALSSAINNKGELCPGGKCSPSLFLLGHQHIFQNLNFFNSDGSTLFPSHYIVGQGGVKLDKNSPDSIHERCAYKDFTINATTATTITDTVVQHGFMSWERDTISVNTALGWNPILYDANGGILPLPTQSSSAPTCNPN